MQPIDLIQAAATVDEAIEPILKEIRKQQAVDRRIRDRNAETSKKIAARGVKEFKSNPRGRKKKR